MSTLDVTAGCVDVFTVGNLEYITSLTSLYHYSVPDFLRKDMEVFLLLAVCR